MQRNAILLLIGTLLGILTYIGFGRIEEAQFVTSDGTTYAYSGMAKMAGVGVAMAFFWITECIPLFVTALIPLAAFPVLNILGIAEVGPNYAKEIIFLFVGSFLLAFAFERWNLHKRIALRIILLLGSKPFPILLGFMISSYLLSMWILNTATVAMLMPAALAVIAEFNGRSESKFGVPLLLGIAFSSSIGGMATPIGTAPNMYAINFLGENLQGLSLSFYEWMKVGLPVSVVMFLLAVLLLWLLFRKSFAKINIDSGYCQLAYQKLGKLSAQEWRLIVVFALTVFAWFFIKDIEIGKFTIPGWGKWLAEEGFIKESTVAIMAAIVLFIMPAGDSERQRMISLPELRKVPYDILLLFGGGFALAAGCEKTGLTAWLGMQLMVFDGVPPFVMIVLLCLFMTFITELTSNTASTVLLLPVVWQLGIVMECDPILLILPMTFSASCAFMLPVATPPNAIVFGSGQLRISDMSRVGVWLNMLGVLVISILCSILVG